MEPPTKLSILSPTYSQLSNIDLERDFCNWQGHTLNLVIVRGGIVRGAIPRFLGGFVVIGFALRFLLNPKLVKTKIYWYNCKFHFFEGN